MPQLERLHPGRLFARDFRVVRPLSEGGMGAVYVVEQLSTGSPRALKLMHPHLVQDPRLRQRFEQEARVAARIESDHVVQVVAAGVDEETQTPWLAMELLKGDDLAIVLAQRGRMPPEEVDEIFSQLCHAIGAAHAAGIVHRDLKPENIFLAAPRSEGARVSVKVLDFGIARMTQEATTALTGGLGTPLWMAPEQTSAGTSITPAADVWALGLIAFRMLTGKSFWLSANLEADTMALLREIVIDVVPSASARAAQLGVAHLVPAGFDAWFGRCVERDYRARFPNATDARAALAHVLSAARAPLHAAPSREWGPPTPATREASAASGTPPPRTVLGAPAFTVPGAINGHTVQAPSPPAYAVTPGRAAEGRATTRAPGSARTPILLFACGGLGLAMLGGLVFGMRAYQGHAAGEQCAANETSPDVRLTACERACGDGGGPACVRLGDAQVGWSERRFDAAATSYQKACDGGALAGCSRLGGLLERGVAKAEGSIEALYRRACEGGQMTGCALLGAAHERGRGVAADVVRAVSLYRQACEGGDALGCTYLAVATEAGRGTKRDVAAATALYARAAAPLQKACDGGEMAECTALAFLYHAGLGVAPDGVRVPALYQRACQGGNPLGCAGLGFGAKGSGPGREWLLGACNDGEPVACNNLAMAQLNAKVRMTRGAPAAWVLEECDAPLGPRCGDLSHSIDLTNGPRDVKSGIALLGQACDGGQAEACVTLAVRHLSGLDVEKSRALAKPLFQRACERGDPDGCRAYRAFDMPFEATQRWQGSYVCSQGSTAADLHITKVSGRRVEGVFHFHHVASGAVGAFTVAGDYGPAATSIRLDPGEWIQRPPNYGFAAFEGIVEGGRFTGRIVDPRCGAFDFGLVGGDAR